jgi:hypothetical protein
VPNNGRLLSSNSVQFGNVRIKLATNTDDDCGADSNADSIPNSRPNNPDNNPINNNVDINVDINVDNNNININIDNNHDRRIDNDIHADVAIFDLVDHRHNQPIVDHINAILICYSINIDGIDGIDSAVFDN